jgi:hypothetical protein
MHGLDPSGLSGTLIMLCNRQQAALLLTRWRAGVVAAAFEAWTARVRVQHSRRQQLQGAVARWQRAQLAACFTLWSTEAQGRAATLQRLTQVVNMCS